ncbi:ephrin type-B receptor 3 [Capsaspora owczarzaki ATCC 30864]|uniref:ephrin type-B receptor 3 n=1 Tax=Capsaspora owczarzaki (strain ATCC 30864) TaxID=595528 RepID=UPI0001FE2FF2|nr:ephrin type-B receptor 3 [Capsaspora owczarzaki ATCC 30864]|eukprot:XP_004345031.1 ephrin type-B receptor 3 [Capsaspora owczarzaki ATCC 30864]
MPNRRLDHNQIINIPADAFAELTTVSTLSLNDNPITTLPPGLFKGLQNDPDLYWSSVDGNSPVLAPNNFTFGGNTAAPPSMYGTATAPYKCDKVCATCFDVGSGSCCGANCLQCTVGNRCTVCYDGYDMKSGYCLASAATNSSLALIASVASSASAVFAASASSASVASRASATSAISASAASVASTKSASVASLASATSAISASVASASAASASSAWQTSAASVASSSPQGDSAASSPVAAIAAAVASVVGVGLIALAVFLVRRRRSQRPVKDSSEPVYHDTVEMNNSLLAKSASKDSDAHYTVLQANPIHQNPEGASYELPQKSPEREGTEGDSHYAAPVARPERQNAEGALRYEMPEKSPNHEDLQGPAQYAVPETNPDRPSSANTSRYEMPERTSPEGVSRYEMPERQGTEGASRYEMPEKPPTGGQNKEAHVHYEEMQNAHVRENKADIPSYEVPEKSTSEPLYHAVSSTSPDDIYDNENVYMTGSNSHRIREGLAIVKHLASGNFGDVSLGEVPFAVLPPRAQSLLGSTSSERVQVAVKSLKSNADEKSRKDFESEARLMAPFVHPNVVHLLAALVESEPHLVLIEFVRYGDLRSLLETSKNKSLWWSENEQVHAIRQIALGMEYLGTLHFVHRDLAARNCLVGQNMVVKIADFGLSRELADESDYYRMQTRGKVPAKWMAPEALTQRKFSSMSDVWSFGVTAWECCSYGDKPYGKIEARDILAHVEAGGRLPMPENCSLGFYHLMLSCWNMTPTLRPSFSQLVASLAAFQDGTAIRDIGALL